MTQRLRGHQKIGRRFSGWAGLVFGALSLGALGGCGRQDSSKTSAQPSQLTDVDFPCFSYQTQSLQQTLNRMPPGLIDYNSFRVGQWVRVVNHLTGLPRSHRDWLASVHVQNGLAISEARQSPGVKGMTYFINGIPTKIQIADDADAVDFALQHEVGHAIHAKVRLAHPEFDQIFQQVFGAERGHPQLRAYARGNFHEYFAEAYANFYCSQTSQQFIATQLPETYALLRRYLDPAPWDVSVARARRAPLR